MTQAPPPHPRDLPDSPGFGAPLEAAKQGGVANLRFLAGALAAVVAVVVLTVSSFDDQIYYLTVAEAQEQFSTLGEREFRIKGNVVVGSYTNDSEDLNLHTFVLEADGAHAEVSYLGPLPDTFADEAEVIALGHLSSPERFEAVEVIAKCPSRYEEAAPTAQSPQASR